MLNVGFQRGGVVTRLEKRGERFVEPYEVYAPRVLAGITGLKDTSRTGHYRSSCSASAATSPSRA